MSITSTEILEDSTQADNSRHIGVKFIFHNGQEIIRRFWANQAFNIVDDVNAMKPDIESYMEQEEDSELMAQIEKGNIEPMDAAPVHPETDTAANRKKRFVRKLVRLMMQNRDMKFVRKMFYPIWYLLKYDSGYNANQIANYFNTTVGKLNVINNRFQAIHDNLTMLDADDGFIEEVD